jgi:WD40 repeat protein
MLSVIKSKYNLPTNDILPQEIMIDVFNFADMCSYIFHQKENNKFIKYDFNTLQKIDEFTIPLLSNNDIIRSAVSPCGNFIAALHYSTKCISILNINENLIQKIFLEQHLVEHMTFTQNSGLLITCDNLIYRYIYSSEEEWVRTYTYEIPKSYGIITYITHDSDNMFLCYTIKGYLCIYDMKKDSLVHEFTDIKTSYEIIWWSNNISSIDFNQNKLIISIHGLIDKYIYIDLKTKTHKKLDILSEGGKRIDKMLFTPGLKKVIGYSGFYNKTYLWDLESGKILKKLNISIDKLDTFTPGGSRLICQKNGCIELINWGEALNN